ETKITKTPAAPPQPLPVPMSLFARQNILRYEGGTPPYKVTLQTDWSRGPWAGTLRSTFYGDVLSPGTSTDGSADTHTGERSLWDLEARYTFPHDVTFALGADNIFDAYPRQISPALNTTGAGPFVYGRLSRQW